MTRDHAERTIRALLNVSLNATNYPLTLEPEPGKTGDWQFRVFYGDKWSLVKPSGHITWNGTEWRPTKPATTDVRRATVMLAPLNASTDLNRLTEAEVRDIVNEFLGTQGMAGYEFTLHNITDNSARFSGPRGGSRNLPVWSGMVKWRNVIRVWGRAVVDYDAEFDKPAAPTEPVPDLTATDLGPFYAAKVKAEAAKPARHPMTRLQIAIADYEAARYAQLHSITTHPDAPTRDALERAVIAAARDVCREAVDQ